MTGSPPYVRASITNSLPLVYTMHATCQRERPGTPGTAKPPLRSPVTAGLACTVMERPAGPVCLDLSQRKERLGRRFQLA